MATATKEVKVEKEVIVCDRCKKPKDKDAERLEVRYGGENGSVITPVDYVVCDDCKEIIVNSLTKTARPRKPKPTTEASQTASREQPPQLGIVKESTEEL